MPIAIHVNLRAVPIHSTILHRSLTLPTTATATATASSASSLDTTRLAR